MEEEQEGEVGEEEGEEGDPGPSQRLYGLVFLFRGAVRGLFLFILLFLCSFIYCCFVGGGGEKEVRVP